MGWYGSSNLHCAADVRAEILTTVGSHAVVVKSTVAGRRLWIAQRSSKDPAIVFVTLYLIGPMGDECWGYKPMDETVGPWYYDCPPAVIDACSAPLTEGAADWRGKVARARETAVRNRATKTALVVGATIELPEGFTPRTMVVTFIAGQKVYAHAPSHPGQRFRVTPRCLSAATITPPSVHGAA